MKINALLVLLIVVIGSCKNPSIQTLNKGTWLAELIVQDNEVLPFNFSIKEDKNGALSIEIYNAAEVIQFGKVETKGDSIYIRSSVFEGYIAGTFSKNHITGSFIKESLDRVVPFNAVFGEEKRFRGGKAPKSNISGIWETEFSRNTEDFYMAKGIFVQEEDIVTGTFRTTTGDYRFLEGVMYGDSLKLSAFDGAHAFLFTAKVTDSTLNGVFYSGNHFKEPFGAVRNEVFELPDTDSLTFLKPGFDKLAFSFPDLEGKSVSLSDDRFKDKVVIVQVMGTWCPNCLDETKFLVNYLNNTKNDQLEVVALAFEYAKTKEKAIKSINRLKEAIVVPYPILLAQYGSSSKSKAADKLPMLNHVLSYPTTIFIDKKGQVRKIHTGFNGPATGEKYEVFKKEFDSFIKELTAE